MKTWKIVVLVIIGILIFSIVALGLTAYSLFNPSISVADNSNLVLRLRGPLLENPPTDFWGRIFADSKPTVRGMLENIRKAEVDKRITGIVLRVENTPVGWAKLEEIREALKHFKTTGKKLVSFLQFAGNKEYYLATVSDSIFMVPTGELFLMGLTAEVTFLKGALEKLGVEAELEHVGRYKTASDILTRKSMSEYHREVVESILDENFNRLVETIAEARKKSAKEVRAIIDQGPFSAQKALQKGLIDSLLYWDQLRDLLKSGKEGKFKKIEASTYSKVNPASLGLNKGPKIALIYATGSIVTGEDSFDPLFGSSMGSSRVVRDIRNAADNSAIKAIVFRIDSPGGSGLASDIIWREVKLAKEKKPFIVSMSDVAASGGYWIAMAADTIVAQPGTLTGSIGVFGGKFNNRRLYDKVGITKEILTRGRYADAFTDYRPFTPEERKRLQEDLWDFYKIFVSKAAEGRKKTFAEIDAIGRGRVWTGKQGLEIGLVDVLGGLKEAIAIAKEKAGIPKDKEVRLVVYPKRKGLLELILSSPFVHILRNRLTSEAFRWGTFSKLGIQNLRTFLEDSPIWAVMPFWVEIK